MKFQFKGFIAGALVSTIIFGGAVSALAASGLMTIEVDPNVNLLVNGEVFQPKNAGGEDVPLFNYQGTIYAPVRALAKAYGLEVGYDQEKNLATITDPDVKANPVSDTATDANAPIDGYSAWKAKWKLTKNENMEVFAEERDWGGQILRSSETDLYYALWKDKPKGLGGPDEILEFYRPMIPDIERYAQKWAEELSVKGRNITIHFAPDNSTWFYYITVSKDGVVTVETRDGVTTIQE